jgi:hypothetical protein
MDDKTTEMVTAVADAWKASVEFGGKGLDMVDKFGGDLLKVIIGIPTDQFKAIRYKLGILLIENAREFNRRHGVENLAPLAAKIVVPLLEYGTLEGDENLHKLWVRLLANAANPERKDTIHPAYIEIIKQIVPEEALILEMLIKEAGYPYVIKYKRLPSETKRPFFHIRKQYQTLCDNAEIPFPERHNRNLDNLMRLAIVEFVTHPEVGAGIIAQVSEEFLVFTEFGRAFVDACIKD